MFQGFAEATVAQFSDTSQSDQCWQLGLEMYHKVGIVAPQAFRQQDWPMLVESVNTGLKLVYPVTLTCLNTSSSFTEMVSNFTNQTLENPLVIVYNLAYHAGMIYEDIVYLSGGDISSD